MVKEVRIECENIAAQIKYLANLEGLSMSALKFSVNELFGKDDSIRNLYNKMKNNRLRVCELAEIAEILNYDIILRKKP